MKIGLVGFGYWGKILHKNLIQMGIEPIVCDLISKEDTIDLDDYRKMPDSGVDYVFIATPVVKHYECVKFFLEKGINVFCEKPLTLRIEESIELYEIARDKKVKLFVDWIFTFNKSIDYIKHLIKEHDLKPVNIMMNRLNNGPIRYDVDASFDLSSHDLSIISYLFQNERFENVKTLNFKRNDSKMNDSSVIFLKYRFFNVQINSSWEYGHKERRCTFQFDKGIIEWDDNMNILDVRLKTEKEIIPLNFFNSERTIFESPLKNSINFFLNENIDSINDQIKITMDVSKILNYENKVQ